MLYILYNVDKPNSADLRVKLRDEHFEYLHSHMDKLVLAGAMLAEDGKTRTGSVFIINVKSRAEAEAFSAAEPFRKGGLFQRTEINHMRKGQFNPAAAPKSAEGD
jgi:uncharacterized protein YciI